MSEMLAPAPAKIEIDRLLDRAGVTGAAAVAYFSLDSPQSFIAARDPDGTITPLIGFWPLPVRGEDLLATIASVDDNGPRLIANYDRAFPELTSTIRSFGADLAAVETESLGWLLGACGLTLGMQEEDIAQALGPVQSLVMVDTIVVDRDDRYTVDSRRLLRSAMSYRIAAVPNHVLARSVFESLGDYAANAIRRLLRDWHVDVVVCAGDLFANPFIADRARRGLTRPRLRVCFQDAEESECA